MEGYVKRKAAGRARSITSVFISSTGWLDRFLVLHDDTLYYYTNKGDSQQRRQWTLLPG